MVNLMLGEMPPMYKDKLSIGMDVYLTKPKITFIKKKLVHPVK